MADVYGLKAFGFEVISLISNGHTERLETIEEQAWNGNLVNYIINKYPDNMAFMSIENSNYNLDNLNTYFQQYNELFGVNAARRKMRIRREEDGLLAIISVIFENYIERDQEY